MMTKYKVGDKVQILDADAIEGGVHHFKTGDITTIAKTSGDYGEHRVYVAKTLPGGDSDALYLYGTEMRYLRKMPNWVEVTDHRPKPVAVPPTVGKGVPGKAIPSDAMTIIAEELMAMRKILERIADAGDGAAMAKGSGQGFSFDDVMEILEGVPEPVNAARARAIEDAAKFIDLWTKRGARGRRVTRLTESKVERLVFADLRKVVVKIHYADTVRVGTAICHPDDTFNVTLGLGIALARALGEQSVARRLANAPQPDEMAPGSVVSDGAGYGSPKTVTHVRPERSPRGFKYSSPESGFTYATGKLVDAWDYIKDHPHILDDTHADYSLAAKKRGGQ